MKKWFKRIMITLIIIVIALAAITYIYLQQAKFGRLPQGERLANIELSSHYKDNQFQNLVPITVVTNTNSSKSSELGFVFRDRSVINPPTAIPTVKTNLKDLDPNKNIIIWLGHSSYLIRIEGKTILIDPVLSHDAAPIPWVNASFKGTDLYTPDELPEIDYLLISHDH